MMAKIHLGYMGVSVWPDGFHVSQMLKISGRKKLRGKLRRENETDEKSQAAALDSVAVGKR
jgi:hypothetical protein